MAIIIRRNMPYEDINERKTVKKFFQHYYNWNIIEEAAIAPIDMWGQNSKGFLWAIEVARTADWPNGIPDYPKEFIDIPYRKVKHLQWALEQTALNDKPGRGIYCILPYDCKALGYMSFSKIIEIVPSLPITTREWFGDPCLIISVPSKFLKICKKSVDLLI